MAGSACRDSQACKSTTEYSTVFREPVPIRAQGMSPARVHSQRVLSEILSTRAASRRRNAKGMMGEVGMIANPTDRSPLTAARIPVSLGSVEKGRTDDYLRGNACKIRAMRRTENSQVFDDCSRTIEHRTLVAAMYALSRRSSSGRRSATSKRSSGRRSARRGWCSPTRSGRART